MVGRGFLGFLRFYIFFTWIFCLLVFPLFGRTVRVATFNVRNYNITDRWVEGKFFKRYPKPEVEKEALRRVIGLVRPDVLVMQEVGGVGFLKELQKDLEGEGVGYPYRFLVEGLDGERHIGVLSREVFVEAVGYDDLNFRVLGREFGVKRGLMELRFRTEGVEWGLFGVHLKSRKWKQSKDYESQKQRIGEATVIRDKIRERYGDGNKENYLIVGDFNDDPKSKTLKRFLESGERVISVMLPAVDMRGEVWTHFREGCGVYSRIDYILVSPLMYGRIKNGGGIIVDDVSVAKASDHRMIYVDVEFKTSEKSEIEKTMILF